MGYLEIYLYGVVTALILGLLSLTFTTDDECNIQSIGCDLLAILVALSSWIFVLIVILAKIHSRYIEE